MKLRAYHNPENVDASRVPDGWRFLYADEAGRKQNKPCRVWLPAWTLTPLCFSPQEHWGGDWLEMTYIVPVNA